jgi:HK97 gp10 family phage protein
MISAEITGLDDLTKGMKAIGKKLREQIGQEAVVTALTPLVNAAQLYAGASKETGALQESIGLKVKPYRKGNIIFGIVGPRKGFNKPDPSGKGFRDPRKYAHLVEFGTVKHSANPFMRPAFAATKGQMISETAAVIGNRVSAEAKRVYASRKKRSTK